MHIALVEGQYRDTPLACTMGLLQWGAIRPEDASVAIQAQPGDLGKMVKHPPPQTRAHTHTQGSPVNSAGLSISLATERSWDRFADWLFLEVGGGSRASRASDPRTPVWPYRLNRETWEKW